MKHVDRCPKCQSRLRELAAGEADWQKAVAVLASVDKEPYRGSEHETPASWNEAMVKQLLEPPSHPEMLGRLGRYEIERMIGSGGMGIVFKAFDTELNRVVAIKVLAPHVAARGSARKRFAREACAAAGVRDDHVVPIFNVESEHEPPFLVMQYVAGGSLQEKLERDGPLDVAEILRIGLQTAKGLAAAQAQGLIHRDVKPSNILLDEGVERALLTDFGLARAEDDACLTHSGFHPGTPHYMSPEQIRGEAIDGRSDLFGLGCVLYALCTGHSPFRADTSYAVMRRITDETPRSIRELNADIPEWLEQIVMKLLSKSRGERFESADEVAKLLEGCLAHVQEPTTTPLPIAVPELAKNSVSPGNAEKDQRRSGVWFPPISKLIAASALAFVVIAGSIIFLESGKGTIRIETNSETDIPIVIREDGKVVEHLTVSKDGATTRLRAGKYVIDVDGDNASYSVEGQHVELKRGGEWIARISMEDSLVETEFASQSHRTTGSHAQLDQKQSDKERYQYLVWEPENRVRLSHWLASSLRLKTEQLQRVNQLLSETWKQYIELEGRNSVYTRTSDGHLVVTIGDRPDSAVGRKFATERERLDDEFWTKLDEIVTGEQRARLHALSTSRGDGNGDDTWKFPSKNGARPRPQAYPSILGWKKDWYPARIEIWKKGTWFHYVVNAKGHQLGPGDRQELPEILQHYYKPEAAEDVASTGSSQPGTSTSHSPSFELAPTKVTIIDENGKPLPDAKVRLKMLGSDDRPVEVENTSNTTGVAIDQLLPYGRYLLQVTTTQGWESRLTNQIVQFGKGLDVTVTAPAVNQLCETNIESEIQSWPDSVTALPFGDIREMSGRGPGYFIRWTPEPGESLDEFTSFPTPGNGVDEIGYVIYLRLARQLSQKDMDPLTWNWSPNGQVLPVKYMLTPRGIQASRFVNSHSFIPANKQGFFLESDNNDIRYAYNKFESTPTNRAPLAIQHPAGKLTIYLTDLYGHPNAEARAALKIEPNEETTPWLPLQLQKNSSWLPALLNLQGWSPYRKDDSHLGHLLRQDFELKPGDATTVRLEASSEKR